MNWLSQQLTSVVDSLMPTSEECARQAAAFDKVSAQHHSWLLAIAVTTAVEVVHLINEGLLMILGCCC